MNCPECKGLGWIKADENPYYPAFMNCDCNPEAIPEEEFNEQTK